MFKICLVTAFLVSNPREDGPILTSGLYSVGCEKFRGAKFLMWDWMLGVTSAGGLAPPGVSLGGIVDDGALSDLTCFNCVFGLLLYGRAKIVKSIGRGIVDEQHGINPRVDHYSVDCGPPEPVACVLERSSGHHPAR